LIVRCEARTGAELPAALLDDRGGPRPSTTYELTIGTYYVVYAMTIRLNHFWYFLADDLYEGWPFPRWHPSPLFSVADGSLSRHWVYAVHPSDVPSKGLISIIAIPQWAQDETFHYRLGEGGAEEKVIWERAKRLLDGEAATALADLRQA
jgi:hypothetical protein